MVREEEHASVIELWLMYLSLAQTAPSVRKAITAWIIISPFTLPNPTLQPGCHFVNFFPSSRLPGIFSFNLILLVYKYWGSNVFQLLLAKQIILLQ